MIDIIVESNLKKLDRIGDISEIAIQNQATSQLDQTHSNLLKYRSGGEFRYIKQQLED